jgi:glutamate N-acetyltransferase/amino-acid N-acetyltransferase
MTTDTVPKFCSAQVLIAGRLGLDQRHDEGRRHDSAELPTALAFVLTDAMIKRSLLEEASPRLATRVTSRITVDGDTSTNDTSLSS